MRVLIVEDDLQMRQLLEHVLEARGHAVTAVDNGEQALEYYQKNSYPLVILDWMLPGIDGLEVCQTIRDHKNGDKSVILMITIRNNPGDLEMILAAGADDYLAKPVDSVFLDIRLKIAEQRVINLGQIKEAENNLVIAKQRADLANMTKSCFLANMSHEIRTPMNAIVGLTHLLRRNELTPIQEVRVDKIEKAADHLLTIINDILDLSKIEAGKIVLEQTNFHLDAVFDHIQSLLSEQAKAKGLQINIDHSDVPIWLLGDSMRLRQSLLNYVVNAIKFTERGEINIRAVMLEQSKDDVLVRFEVEDTGIGIDEKKISGLFESYEQADSSITRKFGGSGLGLVITKHLARLMGGDVGVESSAGQGSLFWFSARLGRGHRLSNMTKPNVVTNAEDNLRRDFEATHILLVEDNAINREVAVELLSGVGLVIDIAVDGLEAIQKAQKTDYALILMDVQMPKMNGLQATQKIRELDSYSATPILAMTANVFEDDRKACLDAGMDDFIAKPFDLNNLYTTILKWLYASTDKFQYVDDLAIPNLVDKPHVRMNQRHVIAQ